MKKSFKSLLILLFSAIALCIFAGCSGTEPPATPPDSETYTVTLTAGTGGRLFSDKAVVQTGGYVKLTAVADDGYTLETLTVNGAEVQTENGEYTVYDVRAALTAEATFLQDGITVKYYSDDGILLYRRTVLPGVAAPYVGKTPQKALDASYYYTFEGWRDRPDGGEPVDEFAFHESTSLYATFERHAYTVTVEDSVSLGVLETKQIEVETDLPASLRNLHFVSSDESVATVEKDGAVTAYAAGTAQITATVGAKEFTVTVTVTGAEGGRRLGMKYGGGSLGFDRGVTTINSVQATVVEDDAAVEYDYVDYSFTIKIGAETTSNLGMQVHKTVNSGNAAQSGVQFTFLVGSTDNISLETISNSVYSTVAGTTTSHPIVVGGIYRMRVVTSPAESNKLGVKCYIDGTEVVSATVAMPVGKMSGIRHANGGTHYLAGISLEDNTPEYAVEATSTAGGTLTPSVQTVRHGGSVTLTVEAEEGHVLETLTVNGQNVTSNVRDNRYEISPVTQAVTAHAQFKEVAEDEIVVRFYSDDRETKFEEKTTQKGSPVTPPEAKKDGHGMTYYEFKEWQTADGTKQDQFTFSENTDLYAVFTEKKYTLSLDESIVLDALDLVKLDVQTDHPHIEDVSLEWKVTGDGSDKVVTVENGLLYAIGTGSATVTASADGVSAQCNVTVRSAEGYSIENAMNDGAAWFENGVATLGDSDGDGTWNNGTQADIFTGDGQKEKIRAQFIDLTVNFHIGCYIGTAANVGIQFCKTENDTNGTVKTGYQVKFYTTDQQATDNVELLKNGTKLAGTQGVTHELRKGNTYKFRIVTTNADGGIRIRVWIGETQIFDCTDATPCTGDLIGFRCSLASDKSSLHRVSIVSFTQNPEEPIRLARPLPAILKHED